MAQDALRDQGQRRAVRRWFTQRYLGGSFGNDTGEDIAADGSGKAYVTGFTESAAFPVADAFQEDRSGVSDALHHQINASGTALLFSSFLGGGNGSGRESGFGIALDAGNVIHVVGSTNSRRFPHGRFGIPADIRRRGQ